MPWIHTRCRACGNQGVSPTDPIDGTFEPGIDTVLPMLRARCPDCGASTREAELVYGEPDRTTDSELHEIWTEMTAFVAGPVPRQASEVGRNDRCPCGSGMKFKKCCGA
ncbi:MAG: SEC-C metal-binding domain-containing protein [Solirubrobacteraceae bacterium]